MDINLNVIEGKSGADDLLFELNLAEPNTYTLEYFLVSGERRTLAITNNPDNLQVDFMIEKGTALVHQAATESEMNISFLSADYSRDIPQWKAYRGSDLATFKSQHLVGDKLHYVIDKKASSKFPGLAFNVNNRILMLRADFNSNKAYLYLDKYQVGTIFPISLTNPLGKKETIQALKSLKDFTASPTHIIKNPNQAGQNYQPATIIVPNTTSQTEKAGSKPGIRLEFEQPRAINPATWQFEFDSAKPVLKTLSAVFDLKDLAGPDNMDIRFSLDPEGDKKISSLPAGNSGNESYHYNSSNHKYQVDIVKDKSGLANQDQGLVQWGQLAKSKIYKARLNLEKSLGQEGLVDFPAFSPQNEFAYTYMEFTLKRADQKEAYLEITPYDVGDKVDLEYTILYNKTYVGPLNEANHLWLKHYQANDSKQTKINIPVPFNDNSSGDHYQILFRFSSTHIGSQLLNYQAEKDKDVPPAMPNIVAVDNLYVSPPEEEAGDQSLPSQIQLDLVWQAMNREELGKIFQTQAQDPNRDNNKNNDAIYYELSVNTLPGESEDNKYQVIQVYKLEEAGDGSYHLRVHPNLASDTWQGKPSQAGPHYANGYDKTDQLLQMEGIILNQAGKWPLAHQAVYDEEQGTYTVTAQTDPHKRIKDLSFPGVNYFRIRAYAEKDGHVMRSRQSMPYSFSMSMVVYDLATTNNLRYSPIYSLRGTVPEGVAIYWDWNKNKTDLKRFTDAMLQPLNKTLDSIKYVGYISQNRQELMKITPEDKQNLLALVPPESQNSRKIQVRPQELEQFRAGQVFYFEVNDLNLKSLEGKIPGGEFLTQITGLDPNTVYYIRFVVEVQVKNGDGTFERDQEGKLKPRTSTPSVILEMTVPKVNTEPGDHEKLPLAPENFKVDFIDPEKVQTYAQWDLPSTIGPAAQDYGFELLNVEDQALAQALKEGNLGLEDLIKGTSLDEKTNRLIQAYGIHKNNIQAYRLVNFGGGWVLQTYDPVSHRWQDGPQADFSMNDRTLKVIDKKNSPNRVLYYYVRTLKYNRQQGVLSRSPWREASLTTPELKGPINLSVDYSLAIDHNPRQERIIYFDVPLPQGVKLHQNYLVQIFVRGEKDGDFVETNKSQASGQIMYGSAYLKEAPGAPNNYQRLYYRLYGLEAGRAYDIKVRLQDHTKDKEKNPDGTYTYVTSPFSDVVRTRTDFDQITQDKEKKYQEYIAYYLKQAQDLKKRPYFNLSTDSKKQIFKYRGPYALGEMMGQSHGQYSLAGGQAKQAVYYLPADWMQAGLDFDTDLALEIQGQTIILPDGFINANDTAEIKEALSRIKEYQARIKDYALMVEVSLGKYTSPIQGQVPLEPFVHISLQLVRETKPEGQIDQDLEKAWDQAVNKNKARLIDHLEKELKYGIKEDKLKQIINQVLDQVEKDFATYGSYQYFSVLDPNKAYITNLNREIKLHLQAEEATAIQVFFREALTWQPLAQKADGWVKTSKPGSFVAIRDQAGQKLADTTSPSERNDWRKFGLDRIFSPQDLIQNGQVLGEQVIRTAARILGAGDSNDTAGFLKKQGIVIPAYNAYQAISKEKAYFILAQTYAKQRNTSLKQVRVTDYNAIEDYSKIDPHYRQDLLAGYHLHLLLLKNGNLSPKAQFTMNDLRNFLKNSSLNVK